MSIFLYCYLTFVKRRVENILPEAGGISEFFLNLVAESQTKKTGEGSFKHIEHRL